MTAGTVVGAFELQAELGRGGMGAVWQAVHRRSGLPVAIKVVTAERARQPGFVEAFRQEARAVAGLDHPGIVRLLDYGELGPGVTGELVPGSPWMAMELGRGGTLSDVGDWSWRRLRRVLLGLLDGLAHAHARGLVHLDLKPANVLLATRTEGAPFRWDGSVQLVDFGLAHLGAAPEGGDEADLAGTPWFMAPEQFRGAWRDFGPWTDLYALGCVAHTLALGRPPYEGDTIYALAFAHAVGPRVEVEAPAWCPPGFADWMDRLLERAPEDRFVRAADAAAELALLPARVDGGDEGFDAGSLRLHAVPELWFGASTGAPGPLTLGGDSAATARVEAVDLSLDGPGFPETWRHREPPPPAPAVVDAGLGLLDLRRPGLTGRGELRDGLWAALRDVFQSGRPRLLLLEGEEGSGRGAIAGWLAERAHELGVATPLSAGDGEALADALSRHLRVDGQAGDERRERLEAWLAARGADEDWALEALDRALRPDGELSAAGRRVALCDALGRAAAGRPVVLTVASPEGLSWDATLPAILALQAPILVVATAAPGSVAVPAGRAGTWSVPPLTRGERAALLERLLPLDAGLAAHLGEASGGRPGLLRLLLAGLVEADALIPGPEGFALRPGDALRLPADEADAWLGRLDDAVDDPAAVEALAALGRDAGLDEWAAVLLSTGRPADVVDLVDVLGRRGLATADGSRVQLEPHLRAALSDRSRRGDRWPVWSQAAAAVVADVERRAPMLAAAGDPAAGPAFLAAAGRRRARGEPKAALALLDQADRSGADVDAVAVARTWAHRLAGDLDAAARHAERVGPGAPRGTSELLRGQIAHARGGFEASRQNHEAVLAVSRDAEARATAWQALADLALRGGDPAEAEARFGEAAAAWAHLGHPVRQADCVRGGAIAARRSGSPDRAAATLERARALYAGAGHQLGLADCLLSTAELDRAAGRLAEAEDGYRRALRIQDAVGGSAGLFPRINLGLVAIARGAPQDALGPLLAARAQAGGRRGILGVIDAATLPGFVAAERWAEAEQAVIRGRRLLHETETAEADAAAPAELAARLARTAGQDELGRACWRLALEQRRRLGQHERAEDLLRWAAGWAAEDPR